MELWDIFIRRFGLYATASKEETKSAVAEIVKRNFYFKLRLEDNSIYQANGPLVIGRNPYLFDLEKSLIIEKGNVSKRHVLLTPNDYDKVFIEDLGSRNGTFVNSQRIGSRQLLEVGDLVQLGGILRNHSVDNAYSIRFLGYEHTDEEYLLPE